MTYSFIQRSGSNFTDTSIKKMQLDLLVTDGSLYRLDFLNGYSNPNPDGTLAGGAVFKNLVQGAADATYTLSSGGMSVATGKKGLSSPGTDTGGSSYLGFPNGEFDMHTATGDHDFIEHLWYKQITGYSPVGPQLLGDYLSETSAWWGLSPCAPTIFAGQNGSGGARPYAILRGPNAATNPPANESLLNAAHLISAAYVGGNVQLWIDGALFSSTPYTSASTLRLPSRRSHGTFVFSGQPSAADTVTINGNVITFVAAGAAGAQVNIGADATATAQALKTYVNANTVTLGATAEGAAATLLILQNSLTTLMTLVKSAANVTVGAVVASKNLRLFNGLKGDYYAVAGEDLTVSGRTAQASAQAEFAGYRPKLVAAGLAT